MATLLRTAPVVFLLLTLPGCAHERALVGTVVLHAPASSGPTLESGDCTAVLLGGDVREIAVTHAIENLLERAHAQGASEVHGLRVSLEFRGVPILGGERCIVVEGSVGP